MSAFSVRGERSAQPSRWRIEREGASQGLDLDLRDGGGEDVGDVLAAERDAVPGDLGEEPVGDQDHVILVAAADVDAVGVIRRLLADVEDQRRIGLVGGGKLDRRVGRGQARRGRSR